MFSSDVAGRFDDGRGFEVATGTGVDDRDLCDDGLGVSDGCWMFGRFLHFPSLLGQHAAHAACPFLYTGTAYALSIFVTSTTCH